MNDKEFDCLIGKTVIEAEEWLKTKGFYLRFNTVNGKPYFGTCDIVMNRVNVEIEKNIIVKVNGLG